MKKVSKKQLKKWEEEAYEYAGLSPKESGLPVTIWIDDFWFFKTFKHKNGKPWIFFQNGYLEDSPVVPMSVSDNPQVPDIKINLFRKDLIAIKLFVRKYKNVLELLCQEQFSLVNIYSMINYSRLDESKKPFLFREFAVLQKQDSGLPLKLWIDNTGTYKKSKHHMRFKVENPKGEEYTHNWLPITLSGIKVKHPENIEISNKDLSDVLTFAEANKDLLSDVSSQKIEFNDFVSRIWKMENGKMVPPPIDTPKVVKDVGYGYFKLQNPYNNKVTYCIKNGTPITNKWFENASDIMKDAIGNLWSNVIYEGNKYYFYPTEDKLIYRK